MDKNGFHTYTHKKKYENYAYLIIKTDSQMSFLQN